MVIGDKTVCPNRPLIERSPLLAETKRFLDREALTQVCNGGSSTTINAVIERLANLLTEAERLQAMLEEKGKAPA